MNYFDKNKILTAAVVLLLLINTGMLAFLWTDRNHPGRGENMNAPGMPPLPPVSEPERGPKDFIIEQLNLNEDQKKQYEKSVGEHKADMRNLHDQIRKDRDELWNNFSSNNKGEQEKLTSDIGEKQIQIERVTIAHFQKLRDICDDNQKKKFDEIINGVIKMMNQGPPPQPPPGR